MHDAHAVQPAEGLSHLAGSAEDALHAGAPLEVGGLRQEPALVHARLQGGAREKGNKVWPGEELILVRKRIRCEQMRKRMYAWTREGSC